MIGGIERGGLTTNGCYTNVFRIPHFHDSLKSVSVDESDEGPFKRNREFLAEFLYFIRERSR